MDDEKRSSGFPISWPGAALLLAVAGNLLWFRAPLENPRPQEKVRFERVAVGDQTAEARLWQDPFEAVGLHRRSGGGEGQGASPDPDVTSVLAQMRVRSTNGSRLTILPVMVTGSPYTEGSEWRVRSRFAILSALAQAGFVPEDREHVGFFAMGWPRKADLASHRLAYLRGELRHAGPSSLLVPYEWMRRSAGGAASGTNQEHALVLWLQEERFEDLPLLRLGALLGLLRGTNANHLVKILGPWGSTTLLAMMEEKLVPDSPTSKNGADQAGIWFTNVTMYSATATAADWLLQGATNAVPAEEPRRDIAIRLASNAPGLRFVNATCTDDQLCEALIQELARRGVDLRHPGHRIALISEWDTFYGRSLPRAFTNGVARMNPAALATVRSFTYLRGLDGKLAGGEANGTGGGRGGDAAKGAELQKQLERPEGNSQLDYVRRLDSMMTMRQRLDAVEAEGFLRRGRFKAIGVLGSDVYDKLLLLQSLRERFPEAIFFTTDLDALLAHPSQLDWTRNLIVASSFGLSVHSRWQGGIPPFRDTYQTAQFLACQLAMDDDSSDLLANLHPRIFEIGRQGPVDMSVAPRGSEIYPPHSQLGFSTRATKVFWIRLLSVTLILAALLALLYGMSPRLRKFRSNMVKVVRDDWRLFNSTSAVTGPEKFFYWVVLLVTTSALLLPLVVMVVLPFDLSRAEGEPFSLLQGISVWPTEILRAVAASLSVCFLFVARFDLEGRKKRPERAVKTSPATGAKGNESTTSAPAAPANDEADELNVSEICLPRAMIDSKDFVQWKEKNAQSSEPTAPGQSLPAAEPHYGRWSGIDAWRPDRHAESAAGGEKPYEAATDPFWHDYRWLGFFWHRIYRILPAIIAFLLLMFYVNWLWGLPFRPFRGAVSDWVDLMVWGLSLLWQFILILYVADAARLCRRFIENVQSSVGSWGTQAMERVRSHWPIEDKYLIEWMNVKLIAERSELVGRLIYYPFFILLLMILARNSLLDRWTWPISNVVLLSVSGVYALYAVLALRKSAEKARRTALARLNHFYFQDLARRDAAGQPAPLASQVAEQIKILIKQVESIEEGAFAPLSRHHVVRALIMPFGGAGILALLELWTSY